MRVSELAYEMVLKTITERFGGSSPLSHTPSFWHRAVDLVFSFLNRVTVGDLAPSVKAHPICDSGESGKHGWCKNWLRIGSIPIVETGGYSLLVQIQPITQYAYDSDKSE